MSMQTIGEYALAAVILSATMALAYCLAAILGGSWLVYVVGILTARVCLWEATAILDALRKHHSRLPQEGNGYDD